MNASNGKVHVLLLEDNQTKASAIEHVLTSNGYDVEVATESRKAIEKSLAGDYQLTMADVCNHGGQGIDFLRGIRSGSKRVPFLALSERNNGSERMRALQEGADDFLLLPFADEELLARVQSVLWRSGMFTGPVLQARDLTMDLNKRIVKRSTKTVALTRTEFSLLELLLKNKNVVLPRHVIREKFGGQNSMMGPTSSTSISTTFVPRSIETSRQSSSTPFGVRGLF